MMSLCEKLDLVLDGRLSALELAEFNNHVSNCPRCKRRIARWANTSDRLAAWAAQVGSEPSSNSRLQLRIKAQSSDVPARRSRRLAPVLVVAGLALTALGAAYVVRRGGVTQTEWSVEASVAGQPQPVQSLIGLGLPEASLRLAIGPDELDVAPAALVDVVERGKQLTRLRLLRGEIAARVKPGLPGRRFIVDSHPFRVSVIGTVFEVTRREHTLLVKTQEGSVFVERLAEMGAKAESRFVSAGQTAELGVNEPTSAGENVDDTVEHEPTPALKSDAGTDSPLKSQVSATVLRSWRRRAAQGKCVEVVEEVEATLKKAPTSVGTLRVYADCQRKLGRHQLAVASYLRVVSLTGGQEAAEARLLAASLLNDELHDFEQVIALTRNLDGLAGSPNLLASLHLRRAQALHAIGRDAEARAEVDAIASRYAASPATAEALRLRAKLQAK